MTKSETAAGWIVFDRVEIDLAGRRLFVTGADVPLEPKAFAVLALLAARPGQAFTRDEILDAVWGHRHVTPGVLNRVITLIRQALGESADTSQYLHTLHGVGYRFDALTQMLPARRAADAAEGASDVAMNGLGGEAALPISPAPAPLPAKPEPDETAEPVPAAALSAGNVAMATANPRRALLWLGALLACVAIGAWYLLAGRPAPTAAGAAPALVVLPLRPVGSAPDERAFADGLSEELITRLARIDGLRLISRTSAALAQSEKLDLNQLAQRLRVTHALEGSLRQSGQQLRIDLRLIEIPSGRAVWAQDYDRGLADVFAIQSEIARSVADALTLKLGLRGTPAEGDPQLFREYLEIRGRLADANAAEYAKTTEQLRAFTARAPEYARAHGLLARALLQELRPSLATAADSAEAAREAARALELDPEQIEAQAALGTLACRNSDWKQCMDRLRHVLTLAPADTVLRTTFGRWLAPTGYLDEALRQTEIATASDPLNYVAIFFRARVLDTLGRHDAAKQALDAAAKVAPPNRGVWLPYSRWYNAIWRHDYAAARESAAAMPADEHFHDAYVAVTEALIDAARWPEAETAIESSERETGRYNFVRLLQPQVDFRKVIEALEDVQKTGSSSYSLLLWNPEYAALRRDPAFQDFLRRTHIIDYWRSNGWPAQCRPEGGGARCD